MSNYHDRSARPADGAAAVVFVTTSWDDGHVLDDVLAARLEDNGLKGTFYIAPRNIEIAASDRMRPKEIRSLSERFEIGGHTLTHVRLPTLPDATAHAEIVNGKDALEDIVGQRLTSFCYPGGRYRARHRWMVRDAGFTLARTVRRGVTAPSAPFETHTTVNAYRHLVDGPAATRLARGHLATASRYYRNWDDMAIATFDQLMTTGGIFHLWGHSWEIDARRDWARLDRVCRHIARIPGVRYIENRDLPIGSEP